jgi:hypothetical protein
VGGGLKRQLLAGASTLCWAIWLSRNDVMFDKTPIKYFFACIIPRNVMDPPLVTIRKE